MTVNQEMESTRSPGSSPGHEVALQSLCNNETVTVQEHGCFKDIVLGAN